MQHHQRTAVVTGGSRGIGREIALRLASAGADVVVGHAGSPTAAAETVDRIVAAGGHAIAVRADVADDSAVRAMFDAAEHEFGDIDVVVNAAGVSSLTSLADLDLDELDAILRTNVRGALVVGQHAVRTLRPGGALVTIASSATRLQEPGNIAYIASKGAVEAITLALARELAGRDVTVNAVSPGPVRTEMLENYLGGSGGEQLAASLAARSPLGRIGEPSDIADVVVFLATSGRWVNGQVVHVNGGAA
ncbi:3-ketoacyl-ACP reductase [Frondihabitans sp. PAMC 28766]|uniref:SDR family oxidoreductase n=1 Tax=Frondihabitans sp. PAMC 28766 TaxID=1795630 RepID=UPI00078CE0D9|nr:SDR family oxidoreductase [Frondihabitans sp. PAMC 28766]AMM21433.1 3-ketoacyl-ACP reductase [Frondihabitans sp. PAMC 28766]